MIRRIRPLVLLLALSACDSPTDPGAALEVHRRIWERQGIDDYRYEFSRICNCAPRGFAVRVEVRDGQVVDVRDQESGQTVPQEIRAQVRTVDALFDRIIQAQAGGQATSVEYHPTMGYPTVAEIGTISNDAGTVYYVTELAPLE